MTKEGYPADCLTFN